jgi:hypothetical protein
VDLPDPLGPSTATTRVAPALEARCAALAATTAGSSTGPRLGEAGSREPSPGGGRRLRSAPPPVAGSAEVLAAVVGGVVIVALLDYGQVHQHGCRPPPGPR